MAKNQASMETQLAPIAPAVKGEAPDDVTTRGVAGHRLATSFIKAAEAVGKAVDAMVLTRKERLGLVAPLPAADLTTFYADMIARQDRVSKDMEAANEASGAGGNGATKPYHNLRAWFDVFPGQGSVYSECSMWARLARAVEAGWKPDMTLPWGKISDSATAFNNSRAALVARTDGQQAPTSEQSGTAGTAGTGGGKGTPVKTGPGRNKQAPAVKATNAAIKALVDDANRPLPKNNRNLGELVKGILEVQGGATVEELREVHAIVTVKLAAAEAAAEALIKAKESANKGEKPAPEVKANPDGSTEATTNAGANVRKVPATPSGRGVAPMTQPEGQSPADKLIEQGKEIVAAT